MLSSADFQIVRDESEHERLIFRTIIAVCEVETFYDEDKRKLLGALAALLERVSFPPRIMVKNEQSGD